jgi:phage terminase large subunit-like protein
MFDEKKALRSIQFFENLKHTKSPFSGKPFTLLDWEKQIVRDVYGTVNAQGFRIYNYVWIEIPKKNGKSEIGAAFALKQLFFDGEINGEVYGCAADKNQASLVFDVACEMIEQVPELKARTKPNFSTHQLTDKKTGTFYKVVSSEAYTKHGLNISAVIGDEIHAWPTRDMFDVMTKGAGDTRLQPLWIFITTAGSDPDRLSIGWEVHEKAESILQARAAGDSEKDIPFWYPVIFSYQGEDIYNEENWKLANPSLGHTFSLDKMRQAAMEAKQSKADERLFRWLRLNQWVTTKLTTWLPLDLFDAAVGSWSRNDLLGKDCYLGGDFSTTTDLSAICLVFPPQDGLDDWRVIWDCWIPEKNMQARIREDHVPYDLWARDAFIQPTEGDMIDHTLIRDRILELNKLYKIIDCGMDLSFATMLIQELEQERMKIFDVPQHYGVLTDPMNNIDMLLRKKIMNADGEEVPALTHEAHPVARWCFGNTSIAKNGNAQIKYVKERKGKGVDRTKRIDLTAAWVAAMSRAKFYQSSKSVYAKRGVRRLGSDSSKPQ